MRRQPGEGTVYYRKADKRWAAAVTLPDGRKRFAYGRTRREAVTKRDDMLRALGQGLEPAPGLLLRDYLRSWLDSVALRVRPPTLKSYRETVEGPRRRGGEKSAPPGLIPGRQTSADFAEVSRSRARESSPESGEPTGRQLGAKSAPSSGLIPGLGHLKLARLTPRDVDDYLARLVAAGARGHTPIRHRAVLSAALADAMREGLIGRNVASLARMPKAVSARQPHAMTLDDARRLLDGTVDDRLHALWVLLFYTGLRESEALGLSWDDVDLGSEAIVRPRNSPEAISRPGNGPDVDLGDDRNRSPEASQPDTPDRNRSPTLTVRFSAGLGNAPASPRIPYGTGSGVPADAPASRGVPNGTLTVRYQLQRRDGDWALVPPKTRSGARTIALATPVVDALRAHQIRMAAERTPDWPYWRLVFVTERGTPLYGWRVLRMLYAHEDRLGLPRAGVHELRHTAASLALASGLALEDVRDLLGHASVAVTSGIYGHATAERQREVADRMADTLGR